MKLFILVRFSYLNDKFYVIYDSSVIRDFDAKKRMKLKVEMQNQPSQPKQSIAI